MNLNKFSELQKLVSDVYNGHYLDYRSIKDTWSMAVYYNKLQNDFINSNDLNEVVLTVSLFNEESNNVESYTIRAKKNFSRKQWFILLVGRDMYNVSAQRLIKTVNEV